MHFVPYVSLVSAIITAGLGAFVLSRNPKSGANWSFAAGICALSLSETGAFLAGIQEGGFFDATNGKIVLAGEILLPVSWLWFGTNLMHSGDARTRHFRRTGWIGACLISAGFLLVFGGDVSPEPIATLRQASTGLSIFLILALTVALAMFESTLRKADHSQRWRIKFLLLGVGAILVARMYVHSQRLLFPYGEETYFGLKSTSVLIGAVLIVYSLIRHQLLDVNVFVSRYFVYNSFTVFAAGVYFLIVGLTAQAIRNLGGTFGDYLGFIFLLVSVLLLLAVLLSTSARKRVRIYIDRHFYRNRYDYHREWLSLTNSLSSKLDVLDIYRPIRNLFSDTLWVDNTRLWICDEGEKSFHFVRFDGEQEEREDTEIWNHRLVGFLKARGYPVTRDELAESLEPDGFENARKAMEEQGITVLIPLIAGDALIGILGCAKSRSGYSMDREDFELMNTVARQAANNFLIARMSQSLVRAKEMETFHAFSAFVLHDMKNFVSMLSLVVQNADRHLDNPEFRKDAMRNISMTVEKMKQMMERLSALTREPDLRKETVNLSELVREVAGELKSSVRARIVEDSGGKLLVIADPAEIRKVLFNLTMNADEAIADEGEIRIATFARDGKGILGVTDNGCGMDPEFVAESLFKPFATTKSHGFGIGLYQVKRIVEAHDGAIEMETAPGKGTTVRILLPQAEG